MNETLKYVIAGAGVLLGQLLLDTCLNLWPALYVAVFPVFLIRLPYPMKTVALMAAGFGTGLCIDILSDGVPGLNAAAALAVAYFRNPILGAMLSRGNQDNLYSVNGDSLGFARFSLLCVLLYAVFFLFYVTLDGIGAVSFSYALMRFLLNTALNAALALLFDLAFTGRSFLTPR